MSFTVALSGIAAVTTELDTISNNIANSGTYGYKSNRANFGSMMAGDVPTGAQLLSISQTMTKGGSILNTGGSMDAVIGGRGFFVARDPSSGTMTYSRVGSFNVDKNGFVVDLTGRQVQGYGVIPGSTALGALGNMKVPNGQIAAMATDKLQYTGNLSRDWTVPLNTPFNANDSQSFNSSMISMVYDSQGVQHTLTQYFVKTGTNQINVHYALDGTVSPTTQNLAFNTDGQLDPVPAVTLSLPAPVGANALAIGIDYTGSTQFGGETTTTANATNGYASGTLLGTQIDDDGAVLAQYTNGEKQKIGTIALATFPSETDLTPIGTGWIGSTKSGQPLYFAPGSGMAGSLTPGMIEGSNVDMTAELVNLMSAQRNYQANTKVIATLNDTMQSLMQAI